MMETSETRLSTPLLGDGKQAVTERTKMGAAWCTPGA